MELNDSFEVETGVDEAWEVLNDVERIAPCLPGAQLQEIEGDEFRGIVKVKVGPISAQYKGKATFIEQNRDEGRMVLDAAGRDTRGAGNAKAIITATLEAVSDTTTKVNVHTDLTITGKVAQFGRGVLEDVSSKLMGQFADNLSELVAGGDEADEAPEPEPAASVPSSSNGSSVRKIDAPEPEAVDLLDAAGAPVLKRMVPALGIIFVLLVLRRILWGGGDDN
ncbi:MAG: SRPBCC family protein [Acidimicrobiales bacterium]